MIKIFISVRNRLEITKKCIEALIRHSSLPNEIYIYNNSTNYRLREHYEYFYNLYKNDLIVQCTFNTNTSTFNSFSKAVSCNQFAHNHLEDPKWNQYDFLVILDNDVIVMPGWDEIIKKAWKEIKNDDKLKNKIKIIGQSPGGIKGQKYDKKISGFDVRIGKLGGSGFWNAQPDFFQKVGLLDIKQLIGCDKRHDQLYWNLLEKINKGEPYIIGMNVKLCIHCGKIAGSICNTLTRNKLNKNKLDLIKFEDAEKKIESMNFNEFMKFIENDPHMSKDW